MIIVTGLPRSGTSLCMQMLEAGGVAVLVDHPMRIDDGNPRGYYELDAVMHGVDWIEAAQGKAVKVVSDYLGMLPPGLDAKFIVMRRDIREIATSRHATFEDVIQHMDRMSERLAGRHCLGVSYYSLFLDPAPVIARIDEFLGGGLDQAAMARVIDPALYRNKA